jgi:hypothetical protein
MSFRSQWLARRDVAQAMPRALLHVLLRQVFFAEAPAKSREPSAASD